MRIVLSLLLLAPQIWAQSSKTYFSFGGGCGNNEGLTRLKENLENSARTNGFNLYSSFHPGKGRETNESAPGNRKHFEAQLDKAIKDFESKDCSVEDCQFVINLTAHGYPADNREMKTYGFPRFETKKHALCLANETPYKTENLRPYLEILKKMRVKIGVIDESCYGGHSAKLFGDLACTLTSTSSIIPHSVTHGSASFSTSHAALSEDGTKPVSMERLMINQLLNMSNYGAVNNLPMVSMPSQSKSLDSLNHLSDVLSYMQGAGFTQKVIRRLPSLSVGEFRNLMFKCSEFYKKARGKPVEVLEQEEWYQDFVTDSFQHGFCRKINFNKNHAVKYDGLVWNEKEKNIYREGLICERKYFGSMKAIENISDSFLGFVDQVVHEREKPMGSKNSINAGELKKYISGLKANLSFYNFSCKFEPHKLIKQRRAAGIEMNLNHRFKKEDVKKAFRTTNISGFMSHDTNDVEVCYKRCKATIKNLRSSKSTRYDHIVASMCLNKLKAFQMIIDKVKEEKNRSNRNLCSQISI